MADLVTEPAEDAAVTECAAAAKPSRKGRGHKKRAKGHAAADCNPEPGVEPAAADEKENASPSKVIASSKVSMLRPSLYMPVRPLQAVLHWLFWKILLPNCLCEAIF